MLCALWEGGRLLSHEEKPKWFRLVELDGCASFLEVAKGGGRSCRGGDRG